MLALVDTCCVSLKPVKLLTQQVPTFFIVLWPAKRSATMLRPFAWNHNNVGFVKPSVHTHCNLFSGLLYQNILLL